MKTNVIVNKGEVESPNKFNNKDILNTLLLLKRDLLIDYFHLLLIANSKNSSELLLNNLNGLFKLYSQIRNLLFKKGFIEIEITHKDNIKDIIKNIENINIT